MFMLSFGHFSLAISQPIFQFEILLEHQIVSLNNKEWKLYSPRIFSSAYLLSEWWEIYHEKCRNVGKLLFRCKKEYFTSKISEIGHDQKQLYKVTNNLLDKTKELSFHLFLIITNSQIVLVIFSSGKIETIRGNLCTSNRDSMSDINALCTDIEFDG
jgi:hypothetical protein